MTKSKMTTLTQFVEWFNYGLWDINVPRPLEKEKPNRSNNPVSLSMMGKPLAYLAYVKLAAKYALEQKIIHSPATQFVFEYGNYFEDWIVACLQTKLNDVDRLRIHSCQRQVELHGIKGHIDGLFNSSILEIKTMSGKYWDTFVHGPNDIRGYLSQASAYAFALSSRDTPLQVSFLCLNKETHKLAHVQWLPKPSMYNTLLKKAVALSKVETLNDLYKIPPPLPFMVGNKKYVPYALRDIDYTIWYPHTEGFMILDN